ncbi:hypothetical protein GZH47_09820 [Paenibacillus rhizovicinus]|uniref:Uncharacterized protein n=1 Tax=Paenibacillus rhizovicinus TaxID=2704463 RepID=A0A6C0NYB0_9BACL|nr:hypothetical protein [Paenibacillus rhizovicinus]QHW31121.1 hypothetical protein GZH47_09820 [Paenibacillus rhizovicinus]
MKQLFIFALLFLLVYALETWLDLLQGLSVSETLHALIKIRHRADVEDYFLSVVFFLPLLISACAKRVNRKKS